MLEAIVLLWIVVKLKAPLWVFVCASLTLLASAISALLSAIESIQKHQHRKLINKRIEELRQRLDDAEGDEK